MDLSPIATTKPSGRYWLGLLFIPVATFVFVAVAWGIYREATKAEFPRQLIFVAWGVLTLLVVGWCVLRDPDLLTWTLTESDLRRGRKQDGLVIPFDDIESIVIGLPPRLPWFFRVMRFHPRSHGAYRNFVALRGTALLLRLRGGRLLPLNVMTVQYENGRAVMQALLRLNEAKVLGPESYTEAEIRRLGFATLNRIVAI